MLTPEELDYALIEAVPLHRTLGLRVLPDGRRPPAVELPERVELGNHLGATAGAAIFAVAEAASAAMVWDAYAPLVDRCFAVPAEATLRFRRPAVGALVARAHAGPPLEELAHRLDETGDTTLPVEVEVHGGDGRLALELRVLWRFRAARAGFHAALARRRV